MSDLEMIKRLEEMRVKGRDIYEVANQLGGYVGPGTEKRLADFLMREALAASDLADEIVRLNDVIQAFEFDKEAHRSTLDRLKRYEDENRDLKVQIVDAWNAFGGQSWTADHIEDLPYMTQGTLAEQIEELIKQRDAAEAGLEAAHRR